MESRKDKHDRYLGKLEHHIQTSKNAKKYSIERFDVLIISLSTSALILSIGFVKNIIPNLSEVNTDLLKISWLFLLTALVSNLISQVFGYFANDVSIKVTQDYIRKERGRKVKSSLDRIERIERRLNRSVLFLNGLSLTMLILGITLLVVFFSKNM